MAYPDLGALIERDGVRFRVWAPTVQVLRVVIEDGGHPRSPLLLDRGENGYHELLVPGLSAGVRYRFQLDGELLLPDPASRFQPEGVHGPSEVVAPGAYRWTDTGWRGMERDRLVFYELHLGTFSPEGTFEGARRRLAYLAELGVTAVELMPVAEFPGRWNWGYDGGAMWAPSRAYGRPAELRALVDEAHRLGLAVFLDVVYNHFGPDGSYAPSYGPFLTDRHHTQWGQAMNLDDRGAAGVRGFLIANALHWLREYHLDGLRLDATFAMQDDSPRHFLAELAAAVRAVPGPRRYVIAEDYRNLAQLVRPDHPHGHGLDGVWADDFHHLCRRILAGDHHGYYVDYPNSTAALAQTISRGWFYTGQYSQHEKAPRGTDPAGVPKDRLVFCIQNHDQIGNRALGERLSHDITRDAYRAASALLLFLPELPLLFMGQEWGASTPFLYFTDHKPELGKRVTEGRIEELKANPAFAGEVPDPQDPATFERCKLRWDERTVPPHAGTLRMVRDLLAMRYELAGAEVSAESPVEGGLVVRRGDAVLLCALRAELELPRPRGLKLVWQSEASAYAEHPRPPVVEESQVRFPAAAAMVFRR